MKKSATALKTIGEVAEYLDLPQHVLRFWETKFTQIKPLKRRGGRRYYRPEDVQTIENIKTLLHERGFTIKGAKAALASNDDISIATDTPKAVPQLVVNAEAPAKKVAASAALDFSDDNREELKAVRAELSELKNILNDAAKAS